MINRATQRGAAGHAVREPGDKLFHLARRAVHIFFHQHLEIGPDHLVTIAFRRLIVAASVGKLANLAEDPGIGRGGTADHHGITLCLRHHGDRIFRRANIAVADHRNLHGVFHRSNPFPASVAAVSLLACAGVESYRIQAAIFSHARQLNGDDVAIIPAQAEFHREWNLHGRAHRFKDRTDHRQVFQQA